MAREAIYEQSGPEPPGDGGGRDDSSLRPSKIAEMVGQRDVIERLRTAAVTGHGQCDFHL